jgi:hypothetical protein
MWSTCEKAVAEGKPSKWRTFYSVFRRQNRPKMDSWRDHIKLYLHLVHMCGVSTVSPTDVQSTPHHPTTWSEIRSGGQLQLQDVNERAPIGDSHHHNAVNIISEHEWLAVPWMSDPFRCSVVGIGFQARSLHACLCSQSGKPEVNTRSRFNSMIIIKALNKIGTTML